MPGGGGGAAAQAAAPSVSPCTHGPALLTLLVLLLAGRGVAQEGGPSGDAVYVLPDVQDYRGWTADFIVRFDKNTTGWFDCASHPGNISEIYDSAVDVLGRSWDPFQYYQEYYTELLPCVGQPSCELFINPDCGSTDFRHWGREPPNDPGDWWPWVNTCAVCADCPECLRQLRITYQCELEKFVADPPPPPSPPSPPPPPPFPPRARSPAAASRPAGASAAASQPVGASAAGTSGGSSDGGGGGGTPVGAVVGGVVAGVCVAAAGLALWLLHRRRQAARWGDTAAAGATAARGSGSGSGSFQPGSKSSGSFDADQRPAPAVHFRMNVDGLKALQQRQRSRRGPSGSMPRSDHSARSSAGPSTGGTSVTQPAGRPTAGAAVPSGKASMLEAMAGSALSWGTGSGTVNIKPWLLPFPELDLHRRIGEGSYGEVYLAQWYQTEVAVKVLHRAGREEELSLSNPLLAGLLAEATTMASLRHPCCVQLERKKKERKKTPLGVD